MGLKVVWTAGNDFFLLPITGGVASGGVLAMMDAREAAATLGGVGYGTGSARSTTPVE
jgi:hypothetical protein